MTDIKLSDRMKMNVNLVTGSAVADIGCDHAFVSIYLVQHNIADRVYAMDVRKGPLDIAKSNVRSYGLETKISVRLSDGFSALEPGEADCAVIAGMGGQLMVRILKEGREHTDAGIHLVLQPQSEPWLVRKYLYDIGYVIQQENMILEDGKYYTAMKAVPAMGTVRPYSREELLYGRELLTSQNPVLKEYLNIMGDKNRKLQLDLSRVHTDGAVKRLAEITNQSDILDKALSYYRQN